MSSPPTTRDPSAVALGFALPGTLALAGFLLHALNLYRVARPYGCRSWALVCPSTLGLPWVAPDTIGYLELADQIRTTGLLSVETMLRTPGYPALLAIARAWTGSATPALWIGAVTAGLAVAAVAWITFRLTRARGAAAAAGLLACLWIPSYRFSAVLLTDAIHAHVAICAVAATLWARDSGRVPAGVLAGLLWMAAQTLRPTFLVAAPLLLPALLYRRDASPRYKRGLIAVWVATLVVPAALVTTHRVRHGVAALSILPSSGLVCEAVPRIEEHLGRGSFATLRDRCHARYNPIPLNRRIPLQTRDAVTYLTAHPGAAVRVQVAAVFDQMLYPMRPDFVPEVAHRYPRWLRVGRPGVALFWIAALGSLWWLRRRDPTFALFLVLATILLMGPASNVYEPGDRYRIVLDFFFLPAVVGAASALLLHARGSRRG